MRRIKIWEGIRENQEVFTGYAGQYLTAPSEQGVYSLYEIARENSDGRLVHEDFEFVMEEPDPEDEQEVDRINIPDDDGWEEV